MPIPVSRTATRTWRPPSSTRAVSITWPPSGVNLMAFDSRLSRIWSTRPHLLGSGDAPEHVARDLIDLALRGGGGDNVSAVVVEAPQGSPSSTQVVRTTGALAWWQKRQRFLQVATDRGLTRNPIARGLPPTEALDVVALSLCQ